jgi:hypothetical protein
LLEPTTCLHSTTLSDKAVLGHALAAGDFEGNGADDLAIGVPWEDHDETGANNESIVQILYGQPGQRLSTAGSQTWDEADLGTGGVPQELDSFGWSLAASPARRAGPGPGSEVYLPLVLSE